ncbi:hypothetical protein [Edaphobacter bradus]|uniref:hypothetical protein n=1 Tax=Edaphobacter bradus TaxID=2259016 RepID=UPI0021E01254|nr:hypothetical protein [Edaphobacter bradus]
MPTSRPSRSPRRLPRRLLKVASLGLAGLIAGLLAGCNSSSLSASLGQQQPSPDTTLTASRRIESLEVHRIPTLRHAPVPHYARPVSRQAYAAVNMPDPALTNFYPTGHYNPALSNISQ